MAETAFSTFKRIFSEHVTARKFPNMVQEIVLLARLYKLFTSLNLASCVVYS